MGAKSAFLNGFIVEEVDVEQPQGFQNKAYTNFVEKGFSMDKIDTTFFTKTKNNYIIIVQMYVSDIMHYKKVHF